MEVIHEPVEPSDTTNLLKFSQCEVGDQQSTEIDMNKHYILDTSNLLEFSQCEVGDQQTAEIFMNKHYILDTSNLLKISQCEVGDQQLLKYIWINIIYWIHPTFLSSLSVR